MEEIKQLEFLDPDAPKGELLMEFEYPQAIVVRAGDVVTESYTILVDAEPDVSAMDIWIKR